MRIKHMKHSMLALIAFLSFHAAVAQSSFPKINKDSLFQMIEHDTSGARFFMVATFVNYCGGTLDIAPNMAMLDSVTNHQTKFFLCQASRGRDDRGEALQGIVNKREFNPKDVYLIDDSQYKTKKKDARIQGAEFRNDICGSCQFSTISGVYYIIFNRKKVRMFAGYVLDAQQMNAILTCDK